MYLNPVHLLCGALVFDMQTFFFFCFINSLLHPDSKGSINDILSRINLMLATMLTPNENGLP